MVNGPGRVYGSEAQLRAELDVTGGRTLVTLGIKGILPFVAPAWVGFLAGPFELLGTNLGGRLWILFGLACLAIGLYLAVRPRAPAAILPAFASVPTALVLLNAQLDGIVALGIGTAIALWSRPFLAGLCLALTLLKPQLMLPAGSALIATSQLRLLARVPVARLLLSAAAPFLSARWSDRLLSSVGAAIAAVTEARVPAVVGVLVIGRVCTRAAGLTWKRREPAPLSAG